MQGRTEGPRWDLEHPCNPEGFVKRIPREDAGVEVENTYSVSPAGCKRRLNGAVSRIKRVAPCRCRAGTLKNPTKLVWRWEPDRRYNFFFGPPAQLCRHVYDWNIVACDVKHQYTQFVKRIRLGGDLRGVPFSSDVWIRQISCLGEIRRHFPQNQTGSEQLARIVSDSRGLSVLSWRLP